MPLLQILYASSCSHHNFICILLHLLITMCMLLVMECFGDTLAPRHATHREDHSDNSISLTHTPKFIAIDIRDKIIELQCHAKCEEALVSQKNTYDGGLIDHFSSKFISCREKCCIDAKKSPRRGFCAYYQNSISPNAVPHVQELSCMNTCNYDYDCPEVQKCCPSTCGTVCLPASGLRNDQLLPEIPKILKYKLPRGHKVEITITSSVNTTCYYHVEARSHIGLLLTPRKFGAWHWQPVEKIAEILDTRTKRTDVAFNAKPGRWYQVRVAAINALGFRGYSDTVVFTLLKRPKPPKPPADLKVVSAQFDNNYYNLKIVWCPSKSNLPVEKYKVIWSLYVKSKGDSLISNESFVKDAHQFLITKLLPDSSYYIQVQAISTSGKHRLKSEKKSLLFNTTSLAKMKRATQPYEPLKCSNSNHEYRLLTTNSRKYIFNTKSNNENDKRNFITETTTEQTEQQSLTSTQNKIRYEVRFRMNRKLGMIVQISGFHPRKERVYELCPKEVSCEQREYSAFRAKKNSLEFSKLKYNTTYSLKAFYTDGEEKTDGITPFNFKTPICESFKKKFTKIEIQC